MRKNKTMRAAVLLLALVLITSCFMSGTYAKYITKADGGDSARVAKWGVTLAVPTTSSFATTYTNTSNSITVSSSDTNKVAAPGTSGTALTFTIAGTPEVSTKVDIAMTVTSDIHTGDYYPIVWTLSQNGTALKTGKLSEIESYIENWAGTATYDPNEDLGATFTLNWAWDFDNNGAGTNDASDTKLGDIAAGKETATANDSTSLAYSVTFTVTQVD